MSNRPGLIAKANKLYKSEGFVALVRGILIRLRMEYILLPFALAIIKNIEFKDINTLIDFSFRGVGGIIRPLQIKSEMLRLLEIVSKRKPEIIIEIGTYNGGTLFLFSRVASEQAVLISIDYPDVRFFGGYEPWRSGLLKGFKLKQQQIRLIWGDSHQANTFARVNDILKGRKADIIFIDGDHSYEGVKKDFEMYNPLVKPDGMIVFHDIVVHTVEQGCEVNKLWMELKNSGMYRSSEIINDINQNTCGLGIIYT
jgi:predicted O-methyltransferase YrrM